MTKKQVVGARLSEAGIAWIDSIAKEYDVNRSQVMRVAFWVSREYEDKVRQVLMWEKEKQNGSDETRAENSE